jgi:phosphoglycerate dehydrogenase-like enzyme/2-keto-3-deoxy-L-rhamnonate aldolase RhmA
MKTAAIQKLRRKLAADEPVFGMWVTLESPSITEMAVALGLDWVVIDAEHGHLDWKEIVEHLRAAVRSETVALVRIAELNGGLIKRALDIGADGIVVPWVETAEQLKQAVAYARYPLEGLRGIGAERATGWGQCIAEHAAEANEHVLVVPIIETVKAAQHAPQMCQVDGVELFLFGPADFSSTAGYRGQWEGPGVAEQILATKDVILRAGKHCGVLATSPENLLQRQSQGFRVLGVGFDAGLLLRSLRASLAIVGRDRPMRASFDVQAISAAPLCPPSEPMHPSSLQAGESKPFRVVLTADFYDAEGRTKYRDIGLGAFQAFPRIQVAPFAEHLAEVGPEQLAGVHGAIVLAPRVTARSLSAAGELLAIGRFGVGYDNVDVAACTAADVLLFITAGAVDRSVAEATVGWMLALSHHTRSKDRLVREARWDERSRFMGSELRERTVGLIGFGGIGRAVARLLAGFGMQPPLAFDPFASAADVARCGAKSVPLDVLLENSDYISLHCPLNEQTRNLLGARELARMKPTAYLINTARGGIVDEDALFVALHERRIAGAAIDCFVGEPLSSAPRLAQLDNVLLAPHSIAWTDELFRDIGRSVCQGMIDLSLGRRPAGAVNPEVFDRPGFIAKLNRHATAGPRPLSSFPFPGAEG